MPQTLSIAGTGETLATNLRRARSRRDKMRGLIGRQLRAGEGLIIERASQVHTFGMSYPIDVLFCDSAWRVVHIVRSMAPRRVTRWVRGARYVVELPAGTIPARLGIGMEIVVGGSAGNVVHPG